MIDIQCSVYYSVLVGVTVTMNSCPRPKGWHRLSKKMRHAGRWEEVRARICVVAGSQEAAGVRERWHGQQSGK